MVPNLQHLGEGEVRLTLKAGPRLRAKLLQNDRAGETLRIEIGDGYFAQVGYEDVASASVPLKH